MPERTTRRRRTIGALMATIAALAALIAFLRPAIREGGLPHHMTTFEGVRWLVVDRTRSCNSCHDGAADGGSSVRVDLDSIFGGEGPPGRPAAGPAGG